MAQRFMGTTFPTGKECDLNRQCGVINPETKKICTRLLTCKIHSVHQRREVQGRAKDFDVLVAELKANSRKGESPKEKSPGRKEPALERPSQEPPSSVPVVAAAAVPSSTFSARAKQTYPYCALPRSRASSESELDDDGPCGGDGDPGLFPFPLPRGGAQASSEESEEEGTSDDLHLPPDCHYATRPPRPQAFCTFGSRLVSPGCYVFSRRLDRFCSALSSMLERHLSSHMWKKIPPAAEPLSHLVSSSLSAPLSPSSTGSCPRLPGPTPRPACPASTPPTKDSLVPSYPAGSPSVAAACSQAECMGGSQAITSPLPANTPSPSFSKLPPSKASKSSKGKDGAEVEAPSRKRKLSPGPTTFKRTCIMEPTGKGKPSGCRGLSTKTKTALGMGLNGTVGPRVKRAGPLDCRGSPHPPPTPVKASQLDNRGAAGHPAKALPTNCLSEEEVAKKRKNLATYCRPVKAKHCQAGTPADAACSVRRKKPGPALAFEEKCSTLKFCLCMAEAILLFSSEHSPFFFCSRKARIRLHWAGQTLAILCASLGLGFIICSRTRSELPHLVSWHSWVGALTLLATGGQALCGLCLLCPQAARVSRVARLKLYHLTCGLVVYLMATATVLLGLYSVWFQAQIKGAAWYLCLALPLYPALVIMHQISSSYLPRKKMEM
nr:ataxin-7-like protein 2 isoform X8 [Equus caballus]